MIARDPTFSSDSSARSPLHPFACSKSIKGESMNNNEPLISCLCITRKKPHMLSRAIRCFMEQSYSNKELVIVYESDDMATIELVKDPAIHCNPVIRVLEVNASPK